MDLNYQDIPDSWVGIPVNVPSSYKNLPDPRAPSKRRFSEVATLRRSLVENAGLYPGTYRILDDRLFGRVKDVLAGLTDCLISELSGLDVVYICQRLYRRHEEFLGQILKLKHGSVPDIVFGDATQTAMDRLRLWERVSPLTEATRWLIEISVKHCDSPGTRPGNAKLDYLIALAHAIYEWDAVWEYIVYGVIPHELTIGSDFAVTARPTARTNDVLDVYHKALKPHLAEKDREWADSVQPPQAQITSDDVTATPEFRMLNQPLEEERGYSMSDWIRFSSGLIDSFGATEYCRLTKVSKLSRFLSNKWNISPERLERLLTDHALSKEALADVEMDKLRPMEYARRDTAGPAHSNVQFHFVHPSHLPSSCLQLYRRRRVVQFCSATPGRSHPPRRSIITPPFTDIRSPVWWARRSFAHRVAAVSGLPYLGLRGGAQYANPFRQTADTLQHAIERAG